MKCPTDGLIRAFADGELATGESPMFAEHLRSCASCSSRLENLQNDAAEVSRVLDGLAPRAASQADAASQAIDPALAYNRFRERFGAPLNTRPAGSSRFLEVWRRRPVWGGVTAACLLALLLSFAPTRTWAQRFLQMLRVEKLATVPVDLSAFGPDAAHPGRGKLIAQLISDTVMVTMKPGDPTVVPSLADARERAGFRIRTLGELGAPQRILIGQEGAFHLTLDRDRIQAVLDNAGRSDIQLPASVDGATIAVHVSKSVRLLYGGCAPADLPPPVPNPAGAAPESSGAPCLDFMQVPSPAVSVPPGLNVTALAEAGLQVAGMTAAEAHAFCQTVDWSSTLIVPIPRNSSPYRTVPVDGVNGTFVEFPARGDSGDRYALIWLKNGILYSVTGKGSAGQAFSAVESLN